MRKTKIICTIGPASEDPAVFRAMCLAGLNVARLNFSHGTHEEHQKKIDMIKAVREELNLPIAIMLDTKGPEYRIRTFRDGKVTLRDGADFTFTTREDVVGDESIVSVSYGGLADDLAPGDRILVNNGLVIFEVRAIEDTEIRCTVLTGGSRKQDLVDLKTFLKDNGGGDIDVIAKIENQSGVDNIDEICSACEGVMVARGDLGVEVPFTELPAIQKHLITVCRMRGKRVITATEMLESMITNPRPTRAEISDVANAVYDGTSAIMLSGESAAGRYPVDSVRVMSEIAEETERHIDYKGLFQTRAFEIHNRVDAISHAACTMAIDLDAKAIVVTSLSGLTVRMVSRFRAPTDILGLATNKRAWYKLSMSWGVLPVLTEHFPSMEVLNYYALRAAKDVLHLSPGDVVVMTGGNTSGQSGNTNVIRIETVI